MVERRQSSKRERLFATLVDVFAAPARDAPQVRLALE
jgi:hypothetical protein